MRYVIPHSAWMVGAYVTRCDHGPWWPQPDMVTYTMRGFHWRTVSYESPQRSSTPGEKFSIITSLCSTSRRTTSLARSCFMLSETARFERFHT